MNARADSRRRFARGAAIRLDVATADGAAFAEGLAAVFAEAIPEAIPEAWHWRR